MTTQPMTVPSRVETYGRKKTRIKVRIELTEEQQLIFAQIVSAVIIYGLFITFFVAKNYYIEHKYDDVVASCRIQGEIKNNKGETQYLCQNDKMKQKAEYMIIEYGNSRKVDENPYINRPVKIFKDGTVE